jgi:transposase
MTIEPAEHPPNGRDVNHSFAHIGPSLVVLTRPTVAIEPSQSALDNPALGQDLKALLLLRSAHNIQNKGEDQLHPFDQHPCIALISPHPPQARQSASCCSQHLATTIAVGQGCAAYQHQDQQAERIKKIWADSSYRGELVEYVQLWCRFVLEIVKRPADQRGFQVQPKRWIVERTLGWLTSFRRLSKDYENTTTSSESMVKIAHIHILLRRMLPALYLM